MRAVGVGATHAISLPVRNAEAGVWSVATGEGYVWAATPRDNALWRIDPKSDAVTRIPMPHPPNGVTTSTGAVWVTVGEA